MVYQSRLRIKSCCLSTKWKLPSFEDRATDGFRRGLKKDGYIKLSPGDTHKHGKVTLSLIMQCVCQKLAVESQTAVVIETVIMSPVMSGAIDGEVKLETIHSWIGKSATHKEKILFS